MATCLVINSEEAVDQSACLEGHEFPHIVTPEARQGCPGPIGRIILEHDPVLA